MNVFRKIGKKFKNDYCQWKGEDTLRWQSAKWFFLFSLLSFIWPAYNLAVIKKLNGYLSDFLWASAWASFGIGAWLVNSRETCKMKSNNHNIKVDRNSQWMHYVLYFGFALFVSGLTAFTLGRCTPGGDLELPLSALIGLSMGFASERLNELIKIS